MVVDWSATEKAFAARVFEIGNLQDNAEKLYHKDAADGVLAIKGW